MVCMCCWDLDTNCLKLMEHGALTPLLSLCNSEDIKTKHLVRQASDVNLLTLNPRYHRQLVLCVI